MTRLADGGRSWGAAKAYAEEDFEDARGGFERGLEIAGDFGFATDAAAVVNREFEDAKVVLGGLDLHFEVPAIGELGHVELREGGTADGTEGAHVGVADALEKAEQKADEVSGEELRGEHGAGLPAATDAGADGEVGLVGDDGIDEAGKIVDDVRAVAIHIDEDVRGGEGGERTGEAGIPIAAGARNDAGSRGGGDIRGGVSGAVIDNDALGDEGPGHGADDVADGGGFVEGGNDDGNGHGDEVEDTGPCVRDQCVLQRDETGAYSDRCDRIDMRSVPAGTIDGAALQDSARTGNLSGRTTSIWLVELLKRLATKFGR